jgi:uncharacterized protein YfaS (alpha-2-macroglobulin family)
MALIDPRVILWIIIFFLGWTALGLGLTTVNNPWFVVCVIGTISALFILRYFSKFQKDMLRTDAKNKCVERVNSALKVQEQRQSLQNTQLPPLWNGKGSLR